MSQHLIFSIEEFSVFDGPGIRTSIFMKGCPLHCEWCHNPEGQSFVNEILRSPNGCIKCGACKEHAVNDHGKLSFSEASINACPQGLLRYCAKAYTAEALFEKLEKNFPILNAAGGGVTFSGGEPMANASFLLECLTLLEGKVHRAVQTCGYCDSKIFERVVQNCDYMLFDIKLMDDALHRKYTGVSNECILENFKLLARSQTDFVVRVPLIPTVTDTKENIEGIAKLLSDNEVRYVELLAYNKMAGAKYKLANQEYTPSFDETIPVETRVEVFEAYGIKVKIV